MTTQDVDALEILAIYVTVVVLICCAGRRRK